MIKKFQSIKNIMENINFLAFRISEYFNKELRNSLKYFEIFRANIDPSTKDIILISNITSQLIDMINIKPKLKDSVEQALLKGFSKSGSAINYIQLIPIDNKTIRISYKIMTYLDVLYLELYVIVASYLNLKDLKFFCESDPDIKRLCNNKIFWTEIFNERFGPAVGKMTDYEILYQGMLKYLDDLSISPLYSKDVLTNLVSKKLIRKGDVLNVGESLYVYTGENDLSMVKLILNNYKIRYNDLYRALYFSIVDNKEINIEQIKTILNSKGLLLGQQMIYIRIQDVLKILNDINYKLPEEVMNILKEHMEGKGQNQ